MTKTPIHIQSVKVTKSTKTKTKIMLRTGYRY